MGGLPYATDVNLSSLAQSQATNNQSASSSSQSAYGTSSSFATQLENAIQAAIAQSGNGSQFDINVQSGEGANSNQYTITVTNEGAASTPGSAAAGSSAATASTASAASGASASASSAAASGTPTFSAAQLATMTPADAYWDAQPPAVQQLRYMQMDERGSYAEQLASEGYTIDVPIMVDGGDPLAVMIQRLEDGYTWVPSGLQPNIPAGPGITFPGLPSYDASSPPPGSIIVSTAFALGTNMAADPVVSAQDAQTYVTDQTGASATT
jgi:hypothetical protein